MNREKEKVINHILIDNLIKKLKGREKKIIEYRYFKEMTADADSGQTWHKSGSGQQT